ncbi:hypothetical protein SAMN04515667_2710 [Formosa sp. Hel1_31_208]|uniref:hypothetical protein n=1 Tax=Formosa sp. Hel1_31_208 TaxID=1798225 RepID=UPI00087CDE5D|nr:hypothetical protein [Formosa sp. Hel1_31_208]SDS67347.1 hypothetical protein SAMN04515667_2710 [Formosa sp. Hel1_31_208]
MIKHALLKQQLIAFLIPIALLLTLVLLLNSSTFSTYQSRLSNLITIDFIITIPLIYFLLIRKTNISKLTIAPFLILCVVIASYTIPPANQDLLSLLKTWLVPIVELSVLTFIILKVRKAITRYKKATKTHQDFYTILVDTCKSIFPKKVARLAANEIALIYYGFFNFKKTILKPNEFSNYKGSGILSTLGAIIFVVAIEMVSVHVLTAKWSATLAWILTILSFYSALQLIGIIRSVPKRPLVINEDHLILRFGILSETIVPMSAIETLQIASASDFNKDKGTKTLSLLGELEHSNIVICLKTPQQLQFLYGKPKTYSKLLLFVDDNQGFKTTIETLLTN